MNHGDAWAMLEQFLDGALPAEERWAVTAHLDDCPACRQRAAADARLRGQLRGRLLAAEPTPGLSDRLRAALGDEPEALPGAVLVRWPSGAGPKLAVVFGPLVAAILLLVLVARPVAPANRLPRELAMTHALFAQDDSLLDVTGDANVVSSWFRDKAGLAFSPPELAGYNLVGGRLIALNGAPVAQLVYESEPEDVYVSLLRFADDEAPAEAAFAREGAIAMMTWPAGNERLALVGAVPDAELQRLADSLAGWTGQTTASLS